MRLSVSEGTVSGHQGKFPLGRQDEAPRFDKAEDTISGDQGDPWPHRPLPDTGLGSSRGSGGNQKQRAIPVLVG